MEGWYVSAVLSCCFISICLKPEIIVIPVISHAPLMITPISFFTEIENFLEAPLVEDDWWEDDHNDDDDDDESSNSDSIHEKRSVTSSFDDDDDDSRVANYIMRLQQQYSNAATSANPQSSWETTDKSIELSDASTENVMASHESLVNNTAKGQKRFCNRGLQTWYLARQKWRPTSTDQGDSLPMMKAKKSTLHSPVIPESFRKELKQCLIDRRHFELSQSIPLSCVVDTYIEVWQENGCD